MKILDLTAPERSDIRYKRFTFPDGQPHFELLDPNDIGPREPVEVIARIKCAGDIVDVGLALDCLATMAVGYDRIPSEVALNVSYMLGARMDRRIAPGKPLTLGLLSGLLVEAAQGVDRIRVLDPHSIATVTALNQAEVIHPDRLVKLALGAGPAETAIVIPDEGAVARTTAIIERLGLRNPVARCVKKRDPATGALSGFALVEGEVVGRDCLIVDDICDGGGTFAGIAEVLRAAGARTVDLCVTHGIFSRGFRIPGIDRTYCTDSYGIADAVDYVAERGTHGPEHFVTYRRTGSVPPVLYVLTDFVREHVGRLGDA